jgi:hypothetical protein
MKPDNGPAPAHPRPAWYAILAPPIGRSDHAGVTDGYQPTVARGPVPARGPVALPSPVPLATAMAAYPHHAAEAQWSAAPGMSSHPPAQNVASLRHQMLDVVDDRSADDADGSRSEAEHRRFGNRARLLSVTATTTVF